MTSVLTEGQSWCPRKRAGNLGKEKGKLAAFAHGRVEQVGCRRGQAGKGAEGWSPAGRGQAQAQAQGLEGRPGPGREAQGVERDGQVTPAVGSPWGSQSQAGSRPRSHLSLKQAFLCWTQGQAALHPVPAGLCTAAALLPASRVAESSGGLLRGRALHCSARPLAGTQSFLQPGVWAWTFPGPAPCHLGSPCQACCLPAPWLHPCPAGPASPALRRAWWQVPALPGHSSRNTTWSRL